jgi:hypothetical protein
MIVKAFEVRDRGTFIPVAAIKLEPADERERWLLGRAGFYIDPNPYVILIRLIDGSGSHDPWGHGAARTMNVAHRHILDNWDTLGAGQVLDVEYILGEKPTPKLSEQHSQE